MSGTEWIVDYDLADSGVDVSAFPLVLDDPILSDGSLLVMDMGWDPDNAASLIDGRKFTNLADESCAALTGGAGDALKPYLSNVAFTTSDGKIEHTAKGGIHVALKQASPGNATHGWRLWIPDEIREYIKDNPTHDYLTGTWSKITRQPGSGLWMRFARTNSGGPAANYLWSQLFDGLRTNGAGNKSSAIVSPTSESGVGVKRHVTRGNGWTGTAPDNTTMSPTLFESWLNWGVVDTLASRGSRVVYRWWIEDLTVSGRTPAQVAALDLAMYTEAFAEGGRFYGDTHTDPATV